MRSKPRHSPMKIFPVLPRYARKLLIIALLMITGGVLHTYGLFEPQRLLHLAREYADNGWLVLVFIVLQVVLYTFALSGSSVLWVAAPIYTPAITALILVAGGTLGSITAYLFSRRLTDEWIRRVERTRGYRLLRRHDNFMSQFALRVLPGFPHSITSYSSGILKTRFRHYIPAAALGMGIKYYIYSVAIYNATSAASVNDLLDLSVYGPLILLSLLALTGVFIQLKLSDTSSEPGNDTP